MQVPFDPAQEALLRPLGQQPRGPGNPRVDAPLLSASQVFSLCVCAQISAFKAKTKQLTQQID